MYSGTGISASFMQWPEHMPRADQAIATFQPEPAATFRTDVDLPSEIIRSSCMPHGNSQLGYSML